MSTITPGCVPGASTNLQFLIDIVPQMPSVDRTRVITASVAPVVIISACSLLCLAFYNRMAAIVSRLRGFQRERLAAQELLMHDNPADLGSDARRRALLELLEVQTREVLKRARLIRWALFFLLLTIVMLIFCCISLGLSSVIPQEAIVSVVPFILGLLSMLAGIVCAMLELKGALMPAEIESRFVGEILDEG